MRGANEIPRHHLEGKGVKPACGMPWFAALAVLLLGVAPARAVGLDQTVPGHPGLTYFELLRLVVTDLTPDGHGGDIFVPFNHIEGKDMTSDLPDTPVFDAVDVMDVPGDPARLMLLVDFGRAEGELADLNLLCLFDLAPAPKLLDLVEVGSDRFTGLRSITPELLAPRMPLILFDSEHSNSNQSYKSTEMIYLDGAKFRLLDAVATFGEAYCSFQRTQEAMITTRPDRAPYRAVQVVVRETVTRTDADCGGQKPPRLGVTTYQATYAGTRQSSGLRPRRTIWTGWPLRTPSGSDAAVDVRRGASDTFARAPHVKLQR